MPLRLLHIHLGKLFRLIVFLSLIVSGHVNAEELPVKFLKFTPITINDGLSQGMVNCMIQDHYGFMWIGTKDGLNRYDGYNFVIYRSNSSDLNSLADNFITALFEDSKGRLWVGTAGHGLDLFDRETETFFHFTKKSSGNLSISDDRILTISEDKISNIWVGTVNGLNKICFTENKNGNNTNSADTLIYRVALNAGDTSTELYKRKPGFALDENYASTFHIDKSGIVWVSTNEMFFRIKPGYKNENEINILPAEKYHTYLYKDKGLEKFIQAYTEDTIRKRLYFIMEFTVVEINQVSGEVKFLSRKRMNYGIFGHQACIDANSTIWLAESSSLLQFNTKTNEFVKILPEDVNLNNMLTTTNCTYVDRSGLVWIGTKGYGILKYNPRTEKFHHTGKNSIGWMNILPEQKIGIISTVRLPVIYDYINNTYEELITDEKLKTWFKEDVGIVECVVQDKEGKFWLGKDGLLKYDPVTEKVEDYREQHHVCFPLFMDDKEKLWMGTENSFSCFDRITKKFTDYPYQFETTRVPYQFLECIYMQPDGIFWLGTVAGILRLDPVNKTWSHYRNIPGDSTSLSFNLIFSICPDPADPDRFLWIGTNGGGLNKFEISTGKFTRFSQRDGLPNAVVYGILSDKNNNLWLSTNNGLSRFNPATKTFRNYSIQDGLQSNEFNRYAYCKNDSWMFFGGVNGFNYFSDAELIHNRIVPPVVITNISLYNKDLSFSPAGTVLKKPSFLASEVNLSYHQNMVTFEFAALDFTSAESNEYRFRLTGFDKNWISAGKNHTATYTNLDPGEYVFSIMGSNNDGIWNDKGASIRVVVQPPWYKTIFFRLFLILITAGLITAIYKYRLNQILKLQLIRNRIASDLHDEIGSNLSAISIFSEVAREQRGGRPTDVSGLLKKISGYSQSSLDAMNDIVWTINSKNDRFENIIVRMRSLAAELLEAKNIEVNLDIDEKLNRLHLGLEERRNFYLIYKEALNNIVKYANCSHVNIRLKSEQGKIIMLIEDDGDGFDMNNTKAGNGLLNMKKRADSLKGIFTITTSPGQGTSIRLSFKPEN
jgi:ligand-binding sensor domain-containing protein/two-component sensor histidine kinase